MFKDKLNSNDLPLDSLILKDRNGLIEHCKNSKSLLKAGEDKGPDGAEGQWLPRNEQNFNLIFLSDFSDKDTDDEIVQMQLDQIPHVMSDKFAHFYINPNE